MSYLFYFLILQMFSNIAVFCNLTHVLIIYFNIAVKYFAWMPFLAVAKVHYCSIYYAEFNILTDDDN